MRNILNKRSLVKLISCGGIFLAVFLFLCFSVPNKKMVLEDNAENVTWDLGVYALMQKNTQIRLADITVQCQAWERRFGKENTLPVELFKDLQPYVAEGNCEGALLAYRQEELIVTVEKMKEICPDFESLIADYFESEQYMECFLEKNKIYQLQSSDGSLCFLLFYRGSYVFTDEEVSYLHTVILEESGEGWRIRGNSSSSAGGVDDYEVFSMEEAGKTVYYILELYGLGEPFEQVELIRLTETFYVPMRGWTIWPLVTEVKFDILFQAPDNELTTQIKAYVNENMWFLAWMQQSNRPVWGDEAAQIHYADYTIRKFQDAITVDADVGADTKSDIRKEQTWMIDFDRSSVFFQMTEEEDGTILLEAYAWEGKDDSVLLFSGQIFFIKEVGVYGCTPAYWEAFDFNGLAVRNTEDNWMQDEVQEKVLREQQQRNITSWQRTQVFSEELLKLLQEEVRTGFYGEENVLLESYKLDLSEDMEIFMEKIEETDWEEGSRSYSYARNGECKWVYRWLAEDGSENFLSCINYNYAKDSIQWWRLAEGGLEEYAYVMETEYPSQIICCEGQVYCITKAVPYYRGGEVYTFVMEIGDSLNWRTSWFNISDKDAEHQDFTLIPLYEAKALSREVEDYVQGRYEEIGKACMEVNLFCGMKEEKAFTTEENRILNSLSGGTRGRYVNEHYFTADVDNDGIVEYGYAIEHGGLDVTFYEKEKGEFRVIPFADLLPDSADKTESLAKLSVLRQLWCEKLGDKTYLFTVEEMAYSPDYILRVRVLEEDSAKDIGIYLLKTEMEEDCYGWKRLEITPTAECAVG